MIGNLPESRDFFPRFLIAGNLKVLVSDRGAVYIDVQLSSVQLIIFEQLILLEFWNF